MTILITGTAGFIGFHLAQRLLQSGHTIIGIDSINDYYDTQLKYDRLVQTGIHAADIVYANATASKLFSAYTFYQLHLEKKEELNDIFKKHQPEIVVNLAAQAGVRYSIENPRAYISSNIEGFANILECCKQFKIQHLVYASSSSVYGLNDEIPFSVKQKTDRPVSLYAATKKSNELMAHVYSHLFQLPTTGLRFFTVYGPWGRPDMAYHLFASAITKAKPIKVFNDGNMLRDFTYIDDITEGIVNTMHHIPHAGAEPPYKIYNIGASVPVQLLDFIKAIENELGKVAQKEFLPMQPGDVVSTYADVSELINDISYKPHTDLNTGVKKFIEWYKDYYKPV